MPLTHIIFVLFFGTALGGLLLYLISRRLLLEKYALLWFMVAIGFVLSPLLYAPLVILNRDYGFPTPTTILFFLAIFFLMLLNLQMALALSRSWKQRKDLAQKVAILEFTMNKFKEGQKISTIGN